MNIDQAIRILRQHPDKPVIIGELLTDEEWGPHYSGMYLSAFVDSARGVYAELAIDPATEAMSAFEVADALTEAIGKTYTGYKGGEYTMGGDTELWIAPYGDVGWRLDDIVADGDRLMAVLGD